MVALAGMRVLQAALWVCLVQLCNCAAWAQPARDAEAGPPADTDEAPNGSKPQEPPAAKPPANGSADSSQAPAAGSEAGESGAGAKGSEAKQGAEGTGSGTTEDGAGAAKPGKDSAEPGQAPGTSKPREPSLESESEPANLDAPADTDQLLEELLTGDDPDSDLKWLYSDRVYESSDLGGEPITAPQLPQRGSGSKRYWAPHWRPFETVHYVLTGTALAASVGAAFLPKPSNPWRKRFGPDEWVRDRVGIQGYDDGAWARDTSDLLLSATMAFPFLVDSLIVTSWYRDSPETGTQMALITLEAISVGAALQGLTSGLGGRERPFVRNCGERFDDQISDCTSSNAYRSFFSGHTTASFAAASVTCSHHIRHEVFGDPVADGLACGGALTAAAAVGTMRIVGDRHFTTDVLTGAGIGMLSGFGIPWLLHYGPFARPDSADKFDLRVTGQGVRLRGQF